MNAPATRWFSLRRRLLLFLLGGVTITWLGAMGYLYVEARHDFSELIESRHSRNDHEEDEHVRKELVEHFATALLSPLLFGLPLLGAWIWFATRRGLAPLHEIARQLALRAPDRLDPVMPAAAPREVRDLLESLNALFVRVEQARQNERRFTADAAHELRTPLAALTTQAQVALRARDAAERDHALSQLVAGSQRAARLVEQLLMLARLDPAAGLPKAALRLDELAMAACADHGARAVGKDIALECEAPAPVMVNGHADMLRVLLRNLLDNALRYTPPGGQVVVAVDRTAEGCRLTVSDSGPGIPAAERENVLRRFHRLAGQETEGSGLGLSIVARIAELHEARLGLGEGMGSPGLQVSVTFPPAP